MSKPSYSAVGQRPVTRNAELVAETRPAEFADALSRALSCPTCCPEVVGYHVAVLASEGVEYSAVVVHEAWCDT